MPFIEVVLSTNRSTTAVLMIAERYLPDSGGTERQLELLAHVLQERGIRVEVVTSRSRREYPAYEIRDGIPVHRLPFVRARRVATLSALIALVLFVLRRRRQFDVIHVHTVHYTAVVATIIGRVLRKRVVLKAVGWWELQEGILDPRRRGRIDTRFCLALLRNADAWVALSDELRDAIISAGIPRKRIHQLPNGVDTRRYCPGVRADARRRLHLDGIEPNVMFVGRLVSQKGLSTLLLAWRTVVAEIATAHLHLVGDGALRANLEDEAGRLNLAGSVTFHGEQSDVVGFLQAADCFVLPSTIEGMSNALLEAMAVGVPLVATQIPGSEALVEDGLNGVLVRAGDANALAHAIVDLLSDSEHAARLGINARRRIQAAFDIYRVADIYQALYAHVAA